MYVHFNPNPVDKLVGDCVIRAISKVTGLSWDEVYLSICMCGYDAKDMPSSNDVWGSFLLSKGFKRYLIPDTCPYCYTVKDFCNNHPDGVFLLATGSHVVAVEDGDYYDAWDSGNEIPMYYWKLERR